MHRRFGTTAFRWAASWWAFLWISGWIAPQAAQCTASASTLSLSSEERVWLEAHSNAIVLWFNTEFPPIEFMGETGRFQGLGADIIERIEKRLGITFQKISSSDWNEHLRALESGVCAIAPTIVRTSERERFAFFTKPYATVPVVIITRSAMSETLSLDDLRDRHVAVVSGYATETYLKDRVSGRFHIVPVANVSQGLRDVAFRQVDAFVENLAVAAYYISLEGIPNLRVAGKTDYAFAWSVGISRKYPLLASAVDKALNAIPEEEIQMAYRRWIAIEAPIELHPETRRKIGWGLAFFLSLVIGLSAISLFLKHRLNRKFAELQRSEYKYRELVENANSIILRMDRKGCVTFINEFAEHFFGYRDTEILGQSVVGTIVPPIDSHGRNLEEMIAGITENPEAYSRNENENQKRDGTRVWIAWTNKAIVDEAGNLCEILCIGNDITELRQSKDRQQALLRFQDQMIDTAAIWIDTLDADGNVTLWNRAAETISGYAREEVLGHDRIWEWLYPDPAYRSEIFAKAMKIIQENHRVEGFETTIRCKNGESKSISWFSNPIVDEQGNATGSIALGIDITTAKRSEAERRMLQDQLLQSQKLESIGRLAGGIAHDFNNKLQAMAGYAEMALLAVGSQEPIRHYLIAIQQTVESAGRLTQQLLAFARKQPASPKVLNLNDTISGMLRMLQRLIGEDISFVWKPGADLWPIKIDPTQLDQILANLCVNARDAISGIGAITIETSNVHWRHIARQAKPGRSPCDAVMLSVQDTGCGMDAHTLEHVFEPFFTTKEADKGTGLGLATVYGIVEQNDGWIDIDSAPGKGTTFRIYFPKATSEDASQHADAQPVAQLYGSETVLFVEDDKTILDIGKSILEHFGYRVMSTDNVQEALRWAASVDGPIHLLVTDVVMPEMNGRELRDRLTNTHPEMKTLFISGYTADIIARQGIIEADVHFLQKPFTATDLVKIVRQILDGDT